MKEIWKDIIGYEGLYQISNLGNVKSLERLVKDSNKDRYQLLKEKTLKPFDNGKGYLIVSLTKDNKRKNHYVHRLVGQCFLDNYDSKLTINHIDFNTKNNSTINLQCCTQKENIRYSNINSRYKRGIFDDKDNLNNILAEIRKLNANGMRKSEICKKFKVSCNSLKKYLPNLKNYGTKGMKFKRVYE